MENTEVLVGELLEDKDNKLVLVARESGLAETKQHELLSSFAEYFTSAIAIIGQSQDLEVTSEDQTAEIEQAGIARKELKRLRCDAEKKRKEIGADSLKFTRATNSMFNVIEAIIKPEEIRLEEAEKIVERAAAARLAKVVAERRAELEKRVDTPSLYNYEHITDEAFTDMLAQIDKDIADRAEAARIAAEAEAERQRKEAAERAAHEAAQAKEAERIRAENAKLKAEAEAREAELAKQRAEDEAKAAAVRAEQEKALAAERAVAEAERKKREALEAEAQAKLDAEAKQKADAEEAQRQSLLATDKQKLQKFADVIDALELPAVASHDASKLLDETKDFLERISKNLRAKASQL